MTTMIWIVFAGMTAAVIAALLWPVVRGKGARTEAERDAYDRAVFRDQLAELDRDVERGTIGQADAEAARNEISRRLIAASQQPSRSRGTEALPWIAILGALIIPAVALPLYIDAGSPMLADVPLAARMADAEKNNDFDALIAKVERHLAETPDDLQGWQILAPAYRRAMRWDDAAEASRNILRLSAPTAENISDYGEALVMASQGMVPAEAHTLFKQALVLDPKMPKARFYDALALKQEGRLAEAKAAFEAFLKDTPADAPWRQMLLAEMQDQAAKPPGAGPKDGSGRRQHECRRPAGDDPLHGRWAGGEAESQPGQSRGLAAAGSARAPCWGTPARPRQRMTRRWRNIAAMKTRWPRLPASPGK